MQTTRMTISSLAAAALLSGRLLPQVVVDAHPQDLAGKPILVQHGKPLLIEYATDPLGLNSAHNQPFAACGLLLSLCITT